MLRPMRDRADCAGEITFRMPRSMAPSSPGALALWRKAKSAIAKITTTEAASRTFCREPVMLLQSDFFQQSELVERLPGAQYHRTFRRVGDADRQAGLLAQKHVQVPQLGAAAGEDDAAVDDVGRQLGGRSLQHRLHRLDD